MPFPWKRVKSAKISRLVNDHLHNSQKRRDGSSLVVETGFPTSLVDLFIKNREKLKKSSKKKRHSPPVTPLNDADDPVIAESPSPIISPRIAGSPDPAMHCPLDCPPALPTSSLLPAISRVSDDSLVVESSDGDVSAGVVGAKRVIFVFVKVFLVVFLALGMKRLTVGITISAFLLLFLEFLGKHGHAWLRPSLDSKGVFVLRLMMQRVCLLLRMKEIKLDEWSGGLLMPELEQDHLLKLDSFESRRLNQEIQIVEAKDYLLIRMEEIQSMNEVTDESCTEGIFRCQEIESKESVKEKEDSNCEVVEVKKIKSRRAKIELKMKKFFSKKLSSRKQHECQRLEIVKEDILCDEQEVDQYRDEGEIESVSELSSISSTKSKNKVEDEMSSLCVLGGSYEANEEAAAKNHQKGKETKSGSTWRYLVLCLIVLVGLIGGRAFALLLTLSWCLLLKLGEKTTKIRETA